MIMYAGLVLHILHPPVDNINNFFPQLVLYVCANILLYYNLLIY